VLKLDRHGASQNAKRKYGRTSQKANRKWQNAKITPQERLSWIIAAGPVVLPFAFCTLPFDFFFALACGYAELRYSTLNRNGSWASPFLAGPEYRTLIVPAG
jgi:hypothetical protein